MSARVDRDGLGQVLAEVQFPAETWQLLTAADYFGADRVTTQALRRIPVARYRDLDGVLDATRETALVRSTAPWP